jgi:hypothetical protein
MRIGTKHMSSRMGFIAGTVILAACLGLLMLGCAQAAPAVSAKTTAAAETSTAAEDDIEVTLDGIKVADITASDIGKLPAVSVSVNGVDKSGATLASVFDFIGIVSYIGFTASGLSPDHTEVFAELDETNVNSEIIFTSANGVLSVFGPEIPTECWDMDITSIAVVACNCGVG